MRYPGLRWHLVTVDFDTGRPAGRDLGLSVHGLAGKAPAVNTLYGRDFNMTVGEDLCPGTVLVLGAQPIPSFIGYSEDAHAVLDEFAVYDLGEPADPVVLSALEGDRFAEGRYYKLNDAAFLSEALEPLAAGRIHLLWAHWTAFLPRESRQELLREPGVGGAGVPPSGVARMQDATLAGADLEVDLMDATGGLDDPPLQRMVQGTGIGRRLDRFRYRVRIRPTPAWTGAERQNQPVLETPYFDDITFACQGAEGPRVIGMDEPDGK
jgi:hypothetical protein